jgi:hypothetical protein
MKCTRTAGAATLTACHAHAAPRSWMPGGRVLGTDHEATLTSTQDLAACLRAQGKLAEVEPLH